MKTYDIDVSLPRRRYWDTDIESPHRCPECQTPLVQDFQMYLMVTKQGKEVEPYLAGNKGGWFCPNCPVVVLNYDEFVQGMVVVSGVTTKEFTVAGIVNSDAIPDDKKHLPFGHNDNPIPLVEFLNPTHHQQASSIKRPINRKKRRKLKRRLKHKKKKK